MVAQGGEERGIISEELRTRMAPFFVAAPDVQEA
jgi:hypothetical protein